MRISDWSSDVCSSDLRHRPGHLQVHHPAPRPGIAIQLACASCLNCHCRACPTAVRFKFGERRARPGDTRRGEIVLRGRQHESASVRANGRLKRYHPHPDRKSIVWGKSWSVRVDIVGPHLVKKKINTYT